MIIYGTPCAQLTYWNEIGSLLINWIVKPDNDSFKDVYQQALQYVATHNDIKFFCIDLTSMGAFEREQEAWLHHEFYPNVFETLQHSIYAAVVFSEDHFKAIVNNYQVPVVMRQNHFMYFNYFTMLEEARHWLKNIYQGKGPEMLLSDPGLLLN